MALDRRDFLQKALAATGGLVIGCSTDPVPPPAPPPSAPAVPPSAAPPAVASASSAPAFVPSEARRPVLPYGVQSGDVTSQAAMIWSRSDRLARMVVEWDVDERFPSPRRVEGPVATADTDFTARLDLGGLPAGRRIFYRVR